MNINDPADVLFDGLNLPHSLFYENGELCIASSRDSKILILDYSSKKVTESHKLEGYIRGVSFNSETIIAGSSAYRKGSKSRNTLRRLGWDRSPVLIYLIDRKNGDVSELVNLVKYGDEIYDIIPFLEMCQSQH